MNKSSINPNLVLNVYPMDFNVQSNLGCLGRILRTIVIISLLLLLLLLHPFSEGVTKFIGLIVIFGGMFLADKYIRRLYPDWPRNEKFIGKISFGPNEIKVAIDGNETCYDLANCIEMVVFSDHFTGFSSNMRDLARNGNALIYLKLSNGTSVALKFNIHTKKEYAQFKEIIQAYESDLVYFKTYLPSEISHILKPDLSGRIIYH